MGAMLFGDKGLETGAGEGWIEVAVVVVVAAVAAGAGCRLAKYDLMGLLKRER